MGEQTVTSMTFALRDFQMGRLLEVIKPPTASNNLLTLFKLQGKLYPSRMSSS
ncbi:conserved hypothetical protein [Ricinus communis]|uniref:Uncharacterized protein n=1 Tax=Ricinus communis TaxID=3988 RepID=B9SFT3_RICCO|nr:conserved hypothetical protein [Ricinus communis]